MWFRSELLFPLAGRGSDGSPSRTRRLISFECLEHKAWRAPVAWHFQPWGSAFWDCGVEIICTEIGAELLLPHKEGRNESLNISILHNLAWYRSCNTQPSLSSWPYPGRFFYLPSSFSVWFCALKVAIWLKLIFIINDPAEIMNAPR